jgi:hypothetical protein
MKRWIGCALLLVPLLLGAADFWDGNAALQRGDASFESGAFAASNSFPPDTRILIQNLDTGKTTQATVTKRIDSQSDILVLLSPAAAKAVGISQGAMASVRVTVVSPPERTGATTPGEQIYSTDPDVNPGAAYGGPTESTALADAQPQDVQTDTTQPADTTVVTTEEPTQTVEETPPTDTQQTVEETPPTDTQQTVEETPPTDTQQTVEETPPTDTQQTVENPPPEEKPTPQAIAAEQKRAEDAAIVADAQARAPQKQLFLPPREDPRFAYHPTVEQPEQPAAVAKITSVTGETTPPAQGQADTSLLAEAAAPGESVPQEIVSVAAKPPAKASPAAAANGPLPEAPKPQVKQTPEVIHTAQATPEKQPEKPAVKPAVKPQVTPKTPIASASLPRSDKPGTYFLQLAAYGSEKGAQDLAATLTPTYPILVVSPQGPGTPVYRVVIGPLNRAESGTLLTWFRYRGFPDAFLKQQ